MYSWLVRELPGKRFRTSRVDLIYRAEGVDNGTIARNDVLLKSMYSVIKEEQNETIAAEKLRKLIMNEVEDMSEEEKKEFRLL